MHLVGRQVHVAVAVAELREVDRAILRPWHIGGKIGLDVKEQMLAQIAREDEAAAADEEVVEGRDRSVALMIRIGKILVVPEQAVDPKLRVAADIDLVVPLVLFLFVLLFSIFLPIVARRLIYGLDRWVLSVVTALLQPIAKGIVAGADGSTTATRRVP